MGRLNGETVAGAAFLFFSFLFLVAGAVNPIFASIYPVSLMFTAFGVGLVALGYRTYRSESRAESHVEHERAEQKSYFR
ncbi:MAG: hypothetical protein ABI361_10490 [Nitrososphaera sp.]